MESFGRIDDEGRSVSIFAGRRRIQLVVLVYDNRIAYFGLGFRVGLSRFWRDLGLLDRLGWHAFRGDQFWTFAMGSGTRSFHRRGRVEKSDPFALYHAVVADRVRGYFCGGTGDHFGGELIGIG